jgi:L-ascorbate metabolism protein UlaG (beta-lactamase superfamily)
MIRPFQQDDLFLDDVAATRSEADRLHIWWLGQSGFLVQWQSRHLLFDPYLSDSLTTKYATTDKPHTRMTERVIAPERLDFIDVVTSSHNHTDHLDADSLMPLLAANPELTVVVPAANQEFAAQRLNVEPHRLTPIDAGTIVEELDIRLTGVPAAHEELARDEQGRYRFLGIIAEFGPWTIYHSGDSILYPGMVETLQQWDIDVAILPINGSKPERRVAGNLNGAEAATLAHDIGAKLVIPCHIEMFEFNTASPDLFIETCKSLGQSYRILRSGERWSSDIHSSSTASNL